MMARFAVFAGLLALAMTSSCLRLAQAGGFCPDGSNFVNCLVRPCDTPACKAKCPAGTTCTDNYCGGCNCDCCKPKGETCTAGTDVCCDGTVCAKSKECILKLSAHSCAATCIPKDQAYIPTPTPNPTTTSDGSTSSGPLPACPDGSNPVNCLRNPCDDKPCDADTLCVPDYCGGCNHKCVKPMPMPGDIYCADGSKPVNCLRNPCDDKPCKEGSTCMADYCGGCNFKCMDPGSIPESGSGSGSGSTSGSAGNGTSPACPNGKTPVNCLVNPCATVDCPMDSVCVADYCNGSCDAKCVRVLPAPVPDTGCPSGSTPVKCEVNPCATMLCPMDSACVPDYCSGKCDAQCVKINLTDPDHKPDVGPTTCPDGSNPVNCLRNPCDDKPCGADQTCVPDYCGGCNHKCIDPRPVPSKEPPAPTACPNGNTPVQCTINPCAYTTCVTGTRCVPDYCSGSCQAKCVALGQPVDGTNSTGTGTGGSGAVSACPDGTPVVQCTKDPCASNPCATGETCKADYCGGCNYKCSAATGEEDNTCVKAEAICTYGKDKCCDGMVCGLTKECMANPLARCGTVCVSADKAYTPPSTGVECKAKLAPCDINAQDCCAGTKCMVPLVCPQGAQCMPSLQGPVCKTCKKSKESCDTRLSNCCGSMVCRTDKKCTGKKCKTTCHANP